MYQFRQDPKTLRACVRVAWLFVLIGALVALMAGAQTQFLGLAFAAVSLLAALRLHDCMDATPPYLVLDEDGIRLSRLKAHIPWSAIDEAALVPQRGAAIRNRLAVELSESALDEALRRTPRLKSVVRQSVLRRRRLEIALPALDASYDDFARAMALGMAQARYR